MGASQEKLINPTISERQSATDCRQRDYGVQSSELKQPSGAVRLRVATSMKEWKNNYEIKSN
jgi:hypothetical protein